MSGSLVGELFRRRLVLRLLHVPKTQAPAALAEFRRVLASGGILYLGVQEGEDEAWEAAPYGSVERFFARYSLDELAALLREAGFTIDEQRHGRTTSRRWLNVLSV